MTRRQAKARVCLWIHSQLMGDALNLGASSEQEEDRIHEAQEELCEEMLRRGSSQIEWLESLLPSGKK